MESNVPTEHRPAPESSPHALLLVAIDLTRLPALAMVRAVMAGFAAASRWLWVIGVLLVLGCRAPAATVVSSAPPPPPPAPEVLEEAVQVEPPDAGPVLSPPTAEDLHTLEVAAKARHGQFDRCYRERIRAGDWPSGTVTYRIDVGAEGKVVDAVILSSTVQDVHLEECVARVARGWSFPGAEFSAVARVTAAVDFGGR